LLDLPTKSGRDQLSNCTYIIPEKNAVVKSKHDVF
jgi:hypothetical protein